MYALQKMNSLLCAFRTMNYVVFLAAASFILAATSGFQSANAQQPAYKADDVVKHYEAVKARQAPPGQATRALCVGTRDECEAKARQQASTGNQTASTDGKQLPEDNFNMLVSFEYASARLSSDAIVNLREFAKGINVAEFNRSKFSIEGHTDGVGSEEYNKQLSDERAAAVRSYLISQGVDGSRLTAVGYGKTRPKVPNNLSDPANRRVESRMVSLN